MLSNTLRALQEGLVNGIEYAKRLVNSRNNPILENDRFREDRHQALLDSQVEGVTFLKNHS